MSECKLTVAIKALQICADSGSICSDVANKALNDIELINENETKQEVLDMDKFIDDWIAEPPINWPIYGG